MEGRYDKSYDDFEAHGVPNVNKLMYIIYLLKIIKKYFRRNFLNDFLRSVGIHYFSILYNEKGSDFMIIQYDQNNKTMNILGKN